MQVTSFAQIVNKALISIELKQERSTLFQKVKNNSICLSKKLPRGYGISTSKITLPR